MNVLPGFRTYGFSLLWRLSVGRISNRCCRFDGRYLTPNAPENKICLRVRPAMFRQPALRPMAPSATVLMTPLDTFGCSMHPADGSLAFSNRCHDSGTASRCRQNPRELQTTKSSSPVASASNSSFPYVSLVSPEAAWARNTTMGNPIKKMTSSECLCRSAPVCDCLAPGCSKSFCDNSGNGEAWARLRN